MTDTHAERFGRTHESDAPDWEPGSWWYIGRWFIDQFCAPEALLADRMIDDRTRRHCRCHAAPSNQCGVHAIVPSNDPYTVRLNIYLAAMESLGVGHTIDTEEAAARWAEGDGC